MPGRPGVRAKPRLASVGFGEAGAHFGEILQGVFEGGASGGLQPGLVTLPLPVVGARALFIPGNSPGVTVFPADRTKARRAAEISLQRWETVRDRGGELAVEGRLPQGWGMGSSTSEVVAAIRAVADALGVEAEPEEIAEIAVKAEQASDPLMFDEAVLFAHRGGEVLSRQEAALPPLAIVGFNTGGSSDRVSGVPTDSLLVPTYSRAEIEVFEDLLKDLRVALRTGDLGLLGEVSTGSARINQRRLPKPGFDELLDLAAESHALGVAAAHSGTVLALLLDPADIGAAERVSKTASRLTQKGHIHFLGCFRAGIRADERHDYFRRWPGIGDPGFG